MDQATARRASAVAVGATTLVLVVGGSVSFAVAPGPVADHVSDYAAQFFAFHALVALTSGAGSALVLARSRHPVGPITALVALLFATAVGALGWSVLAAEHDWPGVGLASHAYVWLSIPGGLMAIAVLPWFVRDGGLPRGSRNLASVGAGGVAVLALGGAVAQHPGAPANPLSWAGTEAGRALVVLSWPAFGVCLVVGLLGVVDVVRRHRRETAGAARAGRGVQVAVPLLFGAATVLHLQTSDAIDAAALCVAAAAQVLLVLSIVALALRTWDRPTGPTVPRIAVWGLLSSIVVGAYVGLVGMLDQVLSVGDRVAGAAGVAVLALLVNPLRQWLQHRVDLLVHGSAADPDGLRETLAAELRTSAGSTDSLEQLARDLRDSLRVGAVAVRSEHEPAIEVMAGTLHRDEPTATYVLMARGRSVGELVVQAAPGDTLSPRARRASRRLADLVAVTLDLTQAELRLQSATERLGQVRLEARRWMRRELHDGMGPVLAGVGLGLAAAQRRLQHDPEAAGRLIDDLRTEITRSSDGVRLLAHSMLPAELDDGDLRGALSVLAARFTGDGLRVRLDTSGLGALDMPRLAACYHVAAEALLNVHRHAQASVVEVSVATSPTGATTLEVLDDGRGLGVDRDPARDRGVGLRSMRERADELGGRMAIEPGRDGRGTRIRLELP